MFDLITELVPNTNDNLPATTLDKLLFLVQSTRPYGFQRASRFVSVGIDIVVPRILYMHQSALSRTEDVML